MCWTVPVTSFFVRFTHGGVPFAADPVFLVGVPTLQEAGISKKVALTIGIAVDHRRTNKSVRLFPPTRGGNDAQLLRNLSYFFVDEVVEIRVGLFLPVAHCSSDRPLPGLSWCSVKIVCPVSLVAPFRPVCSGRFEPRVSKMRGLDRSGSHVHVRMDGPGRLFRFSGGVQPQLYFGS